MTPYFLVGDVGPARMTLGIAAADGTTLTDLSHVAFAQRGASTVEEIARGFLRELELEVAAACFSAAGPVVDGQVWFPSSSRSVDRERLRDALGLRHVLLVNDLQATARALPHLAPSQLATLQMGVPDAGGARAVLAAGAGLGEALLLTHEGHRIAHPSEGGHADFAPNGPLQEELLAWLRGQCGHVSYERVCSTGGIHNVYRFLRGRAGDEEPAWLAEAFAAAADPADAVLAAATSADEARRCPVCAQAVEMFAAILGAESGNLALRTLASGGLYVGGDLPRRLLPLLRGGGFLAAFRHRGVMSDLIRRIPVHVILEPNAALVGSAQYARAAVAAQVVDRGGSPTPGG